MTDVDEIRRQMALIRHEMHHDVSNVVSDVGDAMDWRSVIRNHPYVALGVGLAVGYFVVPRRKTSAQRVQQVLAEASPQALAGLIPPTAAFTAPAPAKPAKPPRSLARRMVGWGVGLLWPLVGQSVQAYAAMWLENQLKQQLNLNLKPPGEYVPPSSSGRPGEPYDGETARRAARRV
ncbi:hypothetical protein [Paludisphaera mucosa]|uniref:DUF883 domain-containing protein n=1 Tax=Paludisphaera mucosa TaxID=3030827 RepID=A0ABT6FL54_9BACT|nr:hypothetical protein [Paludisphaera mucosa]MDG3008095.1 hypothetical protein [Paludisphaera mucosa]